ncbi:MAG: thioesterase domain-containing protein [Flavobacteriaceae bacterium]
MIKDELKNRIRKLSLEERRLVFFKLKNLIGKDLDYMPSERPKHLVAYIQSNGPFDSQQLKSYLKERVPDYMIPPAISIVDSIPLLPNGKIDKKGLSKRRQIEAQERPSPVEGPADDIEMKLVGIWEEVLNFKPVSTNDNFFEIGGDSILSIQIIAKAREKGMVISPNQLFEHQTIKDISVFISSNKDQKEKWDYLVPLRKQGNKTPLFCIHAGGGHVFFYNSLTNYMNVERPIYAIQSSGHYGAKRMHNNIKEMTRDYIDSIRSVQPSGPYNVLVYCLSVTIGHEMAIQMKKLDLELNLIVMDTMARPWSLNSPDRLQMRFKGLVKRLLSKPVLTIRTMVVDRMPQIKIMMVKIFGTNDQKLLETLKANLVKICLDYEWKPYRVKISLILTDKSDKSLNIETIKSWEEIALDGVEVIDTKGNHRTLFEEPDVKFVAETIEKSIRE